VQAAHGAHLGQQVVALHACLDVAALHRLVLSLQRREVALAQVHRVA
jgi:hypothetical protein